MCFRRVLVGGSDFCVLSFEDELGLGGKADEWDAWSGRVLRADSDFDEDDFAGVMFWTWSFGTRDGLTSRLTCCCNYYYYNYYCYYYCYNYCCYYYNYYYYFHYYCYNCCCCSFYCCNNYYSSYSSTPTLLGPG